MGIDTPVIAPKELIVPKQEEQSNGMLGKLSISGSKLIFWTSATAYETVTSS